MERSIYQELEDEDAEDHFISNDIGHSIRLPVTDREGGNASHGVLSAHDLAEWRWANVENLDLFLRDVYNYYVEKGFYCIVLARSLKMITIAFVVTFSTYLYSCVDYSKIRTVTNIHEAERNGCLAQTSWLHYLALYVFALLWILKVFQYIRDTQTLWEIHDFYKYMLNISENEIQTISWRQVVDRLVELSAINGASQRRLDAHGIVNRIMRQENYMIALYNKNILDLEVELPIFGKYEFLTKSLEWSISMCIEDYVFNDRGHLRKTVLRENKRNLLARGLRRRLQFAALMNVLLAPMAVFYMSLYYFFRYFNDFYSNPKNLGIRQYTPLAERKFRELNELYHLFRRRLFMSDKPAQRYISQFPREKTELVIRFFIFVLSSFAAVLAALTIYDPELLQLEIRPGQNILFCLTSLGLTIAVSRAMLSSPEEQAIYYPESAMRQIIEFTHYLPDSWENKLHTEPVKNEFTRLYDLKPKIILRDLLSIALNPVILGIKLANRSERIIDFFREFSVNVDDLGGQVCSLAVFNTDHLDKAKARSEELDRFYSTHDGKMLKSYLNFIDVYGPQQSRNRASMFQSTYSAEAQSQLNPRDVPRMRPFDNNFEGSIMCKYDKLRNELTPVTEETRTEVMDDSRLISEDALDDEDEEEEEEEGIADDGVLALLNNLYKT